MYICTTPASHYYTQSCISHAFPRICAVWLHLTASKGSTDVYCTGEYVVLMVRVLLFAEYNVCNTKSPTHTRMYTNTHTHSCTHIHIHTYTHTHTHTLTYKASQQALSCIKRCSAATVTVTYPYRWSRCWGPAAAWSRRHLVWSVQRWLPPWCRGSSSERRMPSACTSGGCCDDDLSPPTCTVHAHVHKRREWTHMYVHAR